MSPAEQPFGSSAEPRLGGQFGAVAAVAGISLGSSSTDFKDIAIATLDSRSFIAEFLRSRSLVVPFVAGKQDRAIGEAYLDGEVYDTDSGMWLGDVGSEESDEPTVGFLHKEFTDRLSVFEDAATGTVRVYFDWIDRRQASTWLNWLIEDLNKKLKEQALSDARQSISFLQNAADTTAFAEMRTVYFNLLEYEMQKLMLANIREEYAFNVLDPAIPPDKKQAPNRIFIVLMVTTLITIFSMILTVYVRFNFQSGNDS